MFLQSKNHHNYSLQKSLMNNEYYKRKNILRQDFCFGFRVRNRCHEFSLYFIPNCLNRSNPAMQDLFTVFSIIQIIAKVNIFKQKIKQIFCST